ncbi:MAG: flagellar hook capping FlgD N-terminal domain-containing protein [Planctomycetota bacterium]|jgi:flagellar basal-body rod modification protein FlgD
MSQINAFSPADSALQTGLPNRFSEMSSSDFIRIIFTELTHQDPFAPNDSSALLEQLNSIRSIESDLQLEERLKSLVSENQFSAASGLMGKYVTGLTENLDRVSGYVVSVLRQGDAVQLELDNGWRLPMGSVESVTDTSAGPPAG